MHKESTRVYYREIIQEQADANDTCGPVFTDKHRAALPLTSGGAGPRTRAAPEVYFGDKAEFGRRDADDDHPLLSIIVWTGPIFPWPALFSIHLIGETAVLGEDFGGILIIMAYHQ